MRKYLWNKTILGIQAAGAAGKTFDVPIDDIMAAIMISIRVQNADPVAADAHLNIDGFVLNHVGNVASGDAGGSGRVKFAYNPNVASQSSGTASYKFIDSPDGNVISRDLVLLVESRDRICVFGETLRLLLRADEGTSTWSGGTVHVAVGVVPHGSMCTSM